MWFVVNFENYNSMLKIVQFGDGVTTKQYFISVFNMSILNTTF